MRNKQVLDLTIIAMLMTIIIVMAAVPNLGFITIPFLPGVGATIIHIPVIIAAIYFGVKIGTSAGIIFGISSFVVAWIRPVGVLDPVFRNPLVSILPRIVFAFATVYIFSFVKRFIKESEILQVSITAVLTTLLHTILVVPLLAAFGTKELARLYGIEVADFAVVTDFIKAVFIFNGIAEMVLAGLIVPPIVRALQAANKKTNSKDNLILED